MNLYLASLGLAAVSADWFFPAETQDQYLSNFDSWNWIEQPIEEDFPFQDQYLWFGQDAFTSPVPQMVNGWYATEGNLGLYKGFTAGNAAVITA